MLNGRSKPSSQTYQRTLIDFQRRDIHFLLGFIDTI